jgi:hypothetical protein
MSLGSFVSISEPSSFVAGERVRDQTRVASLEGMDSDPSSPNGGGNETRINECRNPARPFINGGGSGP